MRDVKLELDWRKKGEAGARFAALPPEVKKKTSFTGWARDLKNHVYQTRSVQLYKAKKLKLTSHFGETKREFSARLHQVAAEQRDMQLEKLRKKYAPRLARAQERIRKANEKLGVEEEQYEAKRRSSWIDMGSSLLGALFGRKVKSSSNARRAGSVAKSMGRTSKEKADIARAKRTLEAETAKLADLETSCRRRPICSRTSFTRARSRSPSRCCGRANPTSACRLRPSFGFHGASTRAGSPSRHTG